MLDKTEIYTKLNLSSYMLHNKLSEFNEADDSDQRIALPHQVGEESFEHIPMSKLVERSFLICIEWNFWNF